MSDDVGVLDHLSIQCANVGASAALYDAVLAPSAASASSTSVGPSATGFPPMPDFWIQAQVTGDGFRESHIAFNAADRARVREFFAAAQAAGAEVLHEPKLWPEYHDQYYGAFVRDPDGNNVEAVSHGPE